ncbi:MAG: flagellar basal body-associated FliL family protein [Candidatus Eisenbacteria bacterium]
MSDHKEEKADAKGDADKAKAKAAASPLPLIGAAVGALVLGSVLGIFVVAPKIVAARTGAPAAESAGGEHGKEGEKKKKEHGKSAGKHGEKGGEGAVVHKIENLIVNPMGSQGRRFLMMSVAIEVPDAKTEESLRDQDAHLRDLIIGALEGQSIDTITSPGGRDSVKVAIQRVVEPLVEDAEWVHIYLPQFVLQ